MSTIALLASLLLLVITKVADVVTTVRHVGPAAETNPLARRFFARFGFAGGIAFICLLWLAIVAVTYGVTFLQPSAIYRWLTAIVGLFISWIQWETARFNATGRHGWFTRTALRGYRSWEEKWRH